MKVLVIDDDALVAKALSRMLRAHSPTVFASAEAALPHLADADVVFCDVHMHGMSGRELYEKASTSDCFNGVFIFVTGGTSDDQDARFLQDKHVLLKPFSRAALLEMFETVGVVD